MLKPCVLVYVENRIFQIKWNDFILTKKLLIGWTVDDDDDDEADVDDQERQFGIYVNVLIRMENAKGCILRIISM